MRTIFVFLLLICSECVAQKQANIWYFGNNGGVDFNSGSPIALLNGTLTYINYPTEPFNNHNEGTSAISDSSGAILFYSDGMTVWNKDNQVMQNGTELVGNYSSTQSSIIVPAPSNPNKYYYLFTVSSGFCCAGSINDGLRYSKIDMCLDESRGGVLTTEKNIKLVDSIAEKVAVTRHSNGTDYWVLTHKFYSNEFWALHLSENGITDTVITAIGSYHTGNIAGSQGQLKFSPNGNKIAIGGSNTLELLELFDFDKTTGVVSNAKTLYKTNNDRATTYGIEFSPDNLKLYTQGLTTLGILKPYLAQYDLSSDNINSINASLNLLYDGITSGWMSPTGLQLAPDGKIYMVSLTALGASLSVINNPNAYGFASNYQDQAVSLGGRKGSYSLPSFISNFDYSNALASCKYSDISEASKSELLSAYPNPFIDKLSITGNAPYQLLDMIGREVYNSVSKRDLSWLSPGTYILKSTLGTTRVVKE